MALTPDAVAYRWHDPAAGRWLDWSWRRVAAESARWRAAFAAEGLEAGARVATLMVNGVDYVCVDQAALALGLAIAPLHVTDNPGNVGFIIGDCGAAVVILDSADYWRRLAPELAECPELKRVVVLAKPDEAIGDDKRVVRAADWLAAAEGKAAPERPVEPQALAAIVYTSGTTGRPKGVMLSHGNVVANVMAARQCVAAVPGDLFLSFLPLSHTFERTAGYYLPIAVGATVAYARSVAHLVEDMRNVRPTILISVPRIYERAYLAIHERLAKGGALARKLSALAERIGWSRFEQAQGDGARAVADRAADLAGARPAGRAQGARRVRWPAAPRGRRRRADALRRRAFLPRDGGRGAAGVRHDRVVAGRQRQPPRPQRSQKRRRDALRRLRARWRQR